MVRRGQCRCGSVLHFEEGPNGYKTRCSSCGSVVRLKPISTKSRKRPKQKSAQHGRPAPEVADLRRPPLPIGARASRAVACELCNTLVPVEALQCPGCGSTLAVTTAAPLLEDEPALPTHAAVARLPKRWILCWLIAGAALVAAIATVLVLSLQH
jgi:hypothetical protein